MSTQPLRSGSLEQGGIKMAKPALTSQDPQKGCMNPAFSGSGGIKGYITPHCLKVTQAERTKRLHIPRPLVQRWLHNPCHLTFPIARRDVRVSPFCV